MIDPETFGKLVESHAAALVLYARQWCAAAEDVVQEAFLKLMSQEKLPDKVLPWLYRVVRNQAISTLRATERRNRREITAAACSPLLISNVSHAELDPQEAASALEKLPAQEREVITLHLWGGLTFAEIAEVVGGSSSGVHRLYQDGLARLRERLDVPCPRKK